jgi:hypothetical protein
MKCQWNSECKHDAILLIEDPDFGPIPACGFCAQRASQPWRDLPRFTEEDGKAWEARKDDVEKKRKARAEKRLADMKEKEKQQMARRKARAEERKKERRRKRPRPNSARSSVPIPTFPRWRRRARCYCFARP